MTEILNALAIALEADGQVGRAMQSYHRAITLAPDNTDAWCNYGQLLFSERRFADAAQCFEGAQKRLSDALPTGLLLNWAISLAYAGHYDRAFEVIERAVQAGDQAAEPLFTKGTSTCSMVTSTRRAGISRKPYRSMQMPARPSKNWRV